MTMNIMSLGTKILNITLGSMTPNKMVLGTTTLNIMTLGTMNDIEHNET